jgi:hypothetical protein
LREEDAPIDPEARHTHGLWKGTPIKLETDFRFARTQQSMEVQVMAAVPAGTFQVRHEESAATYKIHASSGYSPAAAVIRRFSLARILRITNICNDRRERGRQEWL